MAPIWSAQQMKFQMYVIVVSSNSIKTERNATNKQVLAKCHKSQNQMNCTQYLRGLDGLKFDFLRNTGRNLESMWNIGW